MLLLLQEVTLPHKHQMIQCKMLPQFTNHYPAHFLKLGLYALSYIIIFDGLAIDLFITTFLKQYSTWVLTIFVSLWCSFHNRGICKNRANDKIQWMPCKDFLEMPSLSHTRASINTSQNKIPMPMLTIKTVKWWVMSV